MGGGIRQDKYRAEQWDCGGRGSDRGSNQAKATPRHQSKQELSNRVGRREGEKDVWAGSLGGGGGYLLVVADLSVGMQLKRVHIRQHQLENLSTDGVFCHERSMRKSCVRLNKRHKPSPADSTARKSGIPHRNGALLFFVADKYVNLNVWWLNTFGWWFTATSGWVMGVQSRSNGGENGSLIIHSYVLTLMKTQSVSPHISLKGSFNLSDHLTEGREGDELWGLTSLSQLMKEVIRQATIKQYRYL